MAEAERRIGVSVTCPNCSKAFDISVIVPTVAERGPPTADETLALFPLELHPLLRVEDTGDRFLVKPTKWLGKERFNAAMAVVRQRGGEYIPAGKDSYFSVTKK